MRFIILQRLKFEDKGPAEFIANDFLSELHTDLGTIRRALIDLVEMGLIGLINKQDKKGAIEWLVNELNTSIDAGHTRDDKHMQIKTSSKRLIEGEIGGDLKKIGNIGLNLTIQGVNWLIEHDTLRRTNKLVKYDLVIKGAVLLIGFALGIIVLPIKGCIEGEGVGRQHNTLIMYSHDTESQNLSCNTINKSSQIGESKILLKIPPTVAPESVKVETSQKPLK